MKKLIKTPLAFAVGGTLVSALTATGIQAAPVLDFDANPFTMTELSSGYMQTAQSDSKNNNKMKDGACGEGKCGSAMMKGSEEKTAEGNCAGNKPMPKIKKNKKNMKDKSGSSM